MSSIIICMNIRQASLSDHDQLLSLIVSFELEEAVLEDEAPDAEEMRKKVARHLKENIQEPSRRYFIAEENGKLVGFVSGEISVSAKGVGWFHGLYVDKNNRGVGVGKKLMEAILEWLKANGVRRAKLGVHKQNATAMNLYKKLGFAPYEEIYLHMEKEL